EDEYEVCDADGGRRALEVFSEMRPDLVFLDKIMPDMGGIEVLEKMKQACPLTPVVIFTAYSNLRDATQAIERGASDYIPKPFRVKEIRDRTAELLRSGKSDSLDGESFRQRWMRRKRDVRMKFLASAFVPTS
ncbi:MAG: two-component system response regulator, partial [bacterium]